MTWQILGVIAAVTFPLIGILNAYLLNQMRLELSGLKIQTLELRAKDRDENRAWASGEFMRLSEALARFEGISARQERMENRRRGSDPNR